MKILGGLRSNIGATAYALEQIGDSPDIRLFLLKRATHRYGTTTLATFCREVGASVEELATLLRHRAAKAGLLPPEHLIQ